MKINKLINNTSKSIVTIIALIIACMSMNNFYKITIGFVANDFEGGLVHLTIMIAYFLPVLAFMGYFCNYYVKKFNKIANVIYSTIISAMSIFVLIGVFTNIDIYLCLRRRKACQTRYDHIYPAGRHDIPGSLQRR